MKNQVDSHVILEVYEIVRTHGQKNGHEYVLEGITVSTDHDGYTVYLSGHGVAMHLAFHNTYHFNYESERELELFMKKLHWLRKTYQQKKADNDE
jgi:hypothetical protein